MLLIDYQIYVVAFGCSGCSVELFDFKQTLGISKLTLKTQPLLIVSKTLTEKILSGKQGV